MQIIREETDKNDDEPTAKRTRSKSTIVRNVQKETNDEQPSAKRMQSKSIIAAVKEKPNKIVRNLQMPHKTVRKQIRISVLLPSFHIHELVWGYVRGYPSWPGVIECLTPKGKYLVHFFGDYTRAELGRSCITNFFEGFNQYTSNFGNARLQRAINEARIPQELFRISARNF